MLGSRKRNKRSYVGDEVEGYLYYAKCRYRGTVSHAEYDASAACFFCVSRKMPYNTLIYS